MSNKNSSKHESVDRILKLVGLYSSQKEFLEVCGISNHSYISDLKHGKIVKPGPEYLEKIIRGTGCNGNWLLTGEGEMFEISENPIPESMAADEGISYQYQRALQLIEKIEQAPAEIKALPLPPDIEVRLTRLLLKLLERRLDEPPNE